MDFAVTLSGEGPWGFRVKGGVESNEPLTVYKLISTGKAAQANVKTNDVIVKINDDWTKDMALTEATKIIRSTTRDLRLVVRRGTYKFAPPQAVWNRPTSAVTMATSPVSSTHSFVSQFSPPLHGHTPVRTGELNMSNSSQDKTKLWKQTAGNEVGATRGNFVSPSSHVKSPIETNERLINQNGSTHNVISMATPDRYFDVKHHSPATYEDAYEPRRDSVPTPARPHSAHFESCIHDPRTKQSSPVYKPVITRSPITKAHLYGSNPDDADVESLCSSWSATSNKEEIVREQQYEPMRSPTKVPGYYGRLQHETEQRDAKTDSGQYQIRPSRVEKDAYHSDGEIMRPQQLLSKKEQHDKPSSVASIPKQNIRPAAMNRNPTRSRNAQSSPQSNGVVNPYKQLYSRAEISRQNTGRHGMPSQQYYSDVEDHRTRYIRRSDTVPNHSDIEGQPRRRPVKTYVAPSNQFYSDTEDYDRGNLRRSFLNAGHHQHPGGNTSRRRASAGTAVHGSRQYNGTEPNLTRAAGEVVREPQYTPRALNKPTTMPKYYDKIEALISDDVVAMSDTEAITPRYTRRRKGRYSEGDMSSLNQHQQSRQKMDFHKNKENITFGALNDVPEQKYRSSQYQHSRGEYAGGTTFQRAPAPTELRDTPHGKPEWRPADSTQYSDYRRNATPFSSEDKNTSDYQKHFPTHTHLHGPRSHGNQPHHVWMSTNDYVVQNDQQEIPKYTNPQYFSESEAEYYNTRTYSDSGPDPVHLNQPRRSTGNVYNAIQDAAKTKPRPLNFRVGVDSGSDVYKTVHAATPPGRPGQTSAQYVKGFEDDEIEYYDYGNPVIQSPSFVKLHRILEDSEEL
ncbi:uncharacterized protein LOC102800803 [Saccoglossus kowalevskii]